MKKMEYKTPVLEVRAYAQFENVFTRCNQENSSCRKLGDHENMVGSTEFAGVAGS